MDTKTKSSTLLLIYINIAIYATCYQIQRPLEPFMVEKLGLKNRDSSGEYAKLQSFFSVMQTLGSLLAGPCLDRFGAKGGFILSFLASALSYLLLSQATNLNLLYLSKIPTIFQAGFLCAQLAASEATSDGTERVQALGRLTMSYTIGSVLGPAIGGFLGASGDYYFGAKLAVGGSLLSVLLTLFMPSTSQTARESSKNSIEDSSDKIKLKKTPSNMLVDTLSSVVSIFQVVWLLLGTKIITSVANAMSAACFPLILKNIYGLNEQSLGLSLSAMSAFNGVVNGLFLGPIVLYLGGRLSSVIGYCLAAMALISLILTVVALPSLAFLSPLPNTGLFEFLSLTFVLSMFQYILSTTITGESTSMVQPTQKGTLLGLEHSLFAAARIFAPQAGISLLKLGGVSAVSATCTGVFGAVIVIWNTYKNSIRSNYDDSRGSSYKEEDEILFLNKSFEADTSNLLPAERKQK